MKKGLINEFLHESESTSKLLKAVPDSALDYRPQPQLWSVAELALHIASIYSWFEGTFSHDTFDISTMERPKTDLGKAENIVAEFEKNYEKAREILENSEESTYLKNWSLTNAGQVLIAPTPRIGMIRGFLFNHIYHHRGELVAHLRASGHKVPGLYGPTFEEMQKNF